MAELHKVRRHGTEIIQTLVSSDIESGSVCEVDPAQSKPTLMDEVAPPYASTLGSTRSARGGNGLHLWERGRAKTLTLERHDKHAQRAMSRTMACLSFELWGSTKSRSLSLVSA